MLTVAKPVSCHSGEVSTGDLLGAIAAHSGKPLIFSYDGHEVLPGYHVTEVKSGRFDALDCGANPESWEETFIQLWDIPPEEPGRTFMTVGRFLAIMRKVSAHVPFDPAAKLTFEVSDGVAAMQLFRASEIDASGDAVRVALTQRPASCKPRDRWLESPSVSATPTQAAACCGSQSDKAPCCA